MKDHFYRLVRCKMSITPAAIVRKIKSQITSPGTKVRMPNPRMIQTISVTAKQVRKTVVSGLIDRFTLLPLWNRLMLSSFASGSTANACQDA
jgi:hypothetical protein